MKKAFYFLLFSTAPAWAASGDAPGSQMWLTAGLGGKSNAFHQTIATTTTDVEFRYLEAPYASLSAEKLATVFGRKWILGLNGSLGHAKFTSDPGLALADDKMLLHKLSAEVKTGLFRGQGLVLLLGAEHSGLPSLARPALATGLFTYEKISTVSGLLGLSTSVPVFGRFLRTYLRFAYPFGCGGPCSGPSGFSGTLQLSYAIRGNWQVRATGSYDKLDYRRLDALTGTSPTHELSIFSFGLQGMYSYRF